MARRIVQRLAYLLESDLLFAKISGRVEKNANWSTRLGQTNRDFTSAALRTCRST